MTIRRLLAIALCAAALPAATATAAGPRAARPEWVDHAPMSLARTESAYAESAGRIYVVGGFGIQLANVPTVEVYDVRTGRWSDGPPLPLALNHAMAAAHAGTVYVAGGYTAVVFGAVNTLFALRDGAWTPLAPMPETRAAGAMVALDGKLYVVGGFSQQGTLATSTLVYDIAAGTWSTAPNPPTPREHLTAAVWQGRIYAVGGRTGSPSTNLAVVERYDPRTKTWQRLAPMRGKRSGHASAVTAHGWIVALGGEGVGTVFDSAEAYDVRRNRWVPLPELTSARTGLGAAAYGTRVYTMFGASDAGYLDLMQSIDLRPLR